MNDYFEQGYMDILYKLGAGPSKVPEVPGTKSGPLERAMAGSPNVGPGAGARPAGIRGQSGLQAGAATRKTQTPIPMSKSKKLPRQAPDPGKLKNTQRKKIFPQSF